MHIAGDHPDAVNAVGLQVHRSGSAGFLAAARDLIGFYPDTFAFVPGEVSWYGADGVQQTDGLPECVKPGATVRFAALVVHVDGEGWGEVVAVDCRH